MLLATHAAAICDAIGATGRTVVTLTVHTDSGRGYGALVVTPDDGVRMLVDVGPAGPHAWRWATVRGWSRTSVDTAAEAMQRSGGVA